MSSNTENAVQDYNQDINVDLGRTVRRAAKDYPGQLHQAVIREWLQNSTDGWCTNAHERNVISGGDGNSRPPLEVEWRLDTGSKQAILVDNAGGMPKEVLEDRFCGINTPGDEKQGGGQGGSEGRGFYVMANTVDREHGRVYAETIHESGICYRVGVDINNGKKTGVRTKNPNESAIDGKGTAIIIPEMDEEIFETLVDPEEFEEIVLRWFWNLFNHYDVTARLVVDGEIRAEVDECPFEFTENSLVERVKDFDIFSSKGRSGCVDELEIHERDEIDSTRVPFDKPFCLMKGNEHLDEPYMVIKHYKPRMINAVNKGKVLGYADVSSLCPQFEKRNHKGLHEGICGTSGLRDKITTVCEEEFNIRDSAKETAVLEGAVLNLVNDICRDSDIEDEIDDEYIGTVDTEDDSLDEPQLRIRKARPNHEHDVGDRVTVEAEILETGESRSWVFDSLELAKDGETIDEKDHFDQIETEADGCNKKKIYSFDPEEDAKYRVTVSTATVGGGSTVTKESSLNIYVGDAEPNYTPTPTPPKPKPDEGGGDVLSEFDIDSYPLSPKEAFVTKTEDGLEAAVNISHPRLKRIAKNHSKEQAKNEQLVEFTCAVLDEIKMMQIRENADKDSNDASQFVQDINIKIQKLRKEATETVMDNE